jgi:malate permease and related proteins
MLLNIVNSLAPIVILIGLGAALRASKFLSAEFFTGMNKLCYWVGLPALLFTEIAATRIQSGTALSTSFVLLLGLLVGLVAGYVYALLAKLPSPSTGSFVQAAFRGNLAYVGLPVVMYALASAGDAKELRALAVLAFAPVIPIYNILSVIILSHHGRKDASLEWRELVTQVLTNPLILACLAGFLFMYYRVELPAAATRTLTALGQIALPLSLLAIGASLTFERVKGSLWHAIPAAVIKSVLTPFAGVGLAAWLGLDAAQTTIALIYLACPTAVASYVMAEQLGTDEALAGSAVVVSTLLSFVPLAIVVGMAVK